MPPTDADVRAQYADLLDGDGNDDMVQLTGILHAAYGMTRAPAELRARVPRHPLTQAWHALDEAEKRRVAHELALGANGQRRLRRTVARHARVSTLGFLTVAMILLLVAAGVTQAQPKPPNPAALGAPTHALPTYNPAAGFHRIPTNLRSHGKPEFLLMGTLADYSSASVRWPVVKALAQFGTFTGLTAATQSCPNVQDPPFNSASSVPGAHEREPCGPPTFDLLHTAYHSRYVSFAEKDLLDQQLHLYVNRLSPVERTVYRRYARVSTSSDEIDNVWKSVLGYDPTNASRRLPLFLIGNELQTGILNTTSGDFDLSWPGGYPGTRPNWSFVSFVSFDMARSSLLRNVMPKPSNGVAYSSTLLSNVNIDTNIFTAVICHADGMQPKPVCGRPVLRTIMKHLK